MKSTLIFSTNKPDEDHRNLLTLERLKRKRQRQLIKEINKPKKPENHYSPEYEIKDLEYFNVDDDINEQYKLNILQNSELPIVQEGFPSVQSYYNELHNPVKPIGWYIADYVLKFHR
jgi:hypothetical protein